MNKKTNKSKLIFAIFLIFSMTLFWGMIPSVPEEGMYPLSEIPSEDLVNAGLRIDPQEIFNPNGVSLIDAMVKLGGCTGSFVSGNGLIITNHHCAFGAIRSASTPEQNYLEDGFLADTRDLEIPAKGYTCRITESYEDVSQRVLSAVEDVEDLSERQKIIGEMMKKIGEEATDEENSIEGRVSEMFIGKTYVLFKYRMIKDVRLVYAPPRSIGEFGGETDNWIWPRHTCDFSFMRAYVAPDGSAANYSEENVPFTPKKFLQIDPDGVDEGDFVFVLGYPGRTYRHYPAKFIEYQQKIQLPYISQLFEWMIRHLESLSADDEVLKLQYASRIKGLANTMKNYKGKLKGLKRIELVKKKAEEEEALRQYINENSELKEKYGTLLNELNSTYETSMNLGEAYLWLRMFTRFPGIYSIANSVQSFQDEYKEAETDEEKAKLFDDLKNRADKSISNLDLKVEKPMLSKMVTDALKIKGEKINALADLKEDDVETYLNSLFNSKIFDEGYRANTLFENPENTLNFDDELMKFTEAVTNQIDELGSVYENTSATLKKLLAQYVDVKMDWKKTLFIPDANGTLRLTYGFVKGYEPADAMYYSPITTLDGVIDKSMLGGEYVIPDKLRTLYEAKDFGEFYDEKVEGVPVAILYNMDTTGGNSGSPILDADGELVGVNFDRAYEATINDYAWNEAYSRSIGVDIRYVLWIAKHFSGADNLMNEMGVN